MTGLADWITGPAANFVTGAAPVAAGAGLLASGGAQVANALYGQQYAKQQGRYFQGQLDLANRQQAAAEQEQARRAGLTNQIAAYSSQPLNYDVNAFYQPVTEAEREIIARQYAADAAVRGLPRDSGAYLTALSQDVLAPTAYQRTLNAQNQAMNWALAQRGAQTGPLTTAAGFAQSPYPQYPSLPQYAVPNPGDSTAAWSLLASARQGRTPTGTTAGPRLPGQGQPQDDTLQYGYSLYPNIT